MWRCGCWDWDSTLPLCSVNRGLWRREGHLSVPSTLCFFTQGSSCLHRQQPNPLCGCCKDRRQSCPSQQPPCPSGFWAQVQETCIPGPGQQQQWRAAPPPSPQLLLRRATSTLKCFLQSTILEAKCSSLTASVSSKLPTGRSRLAALGRPLLLLPTLCTIFCVWLLLTSPTHSKMKGRGDAP